MTNVALPNIRCFTSSFEHSTALPREATKAQSKARTTNKASQKSSEAHFRAFLEKRQTENGIEFYLFHKDYDDKIYVVGGPSYDEAEIKYYIWANTDEFTDCIISEEDVD